MIKRERYLKQIRPFYDSDLIKIITGIRRCGKSIILQHIQKELNEQNKNTIYLDFEDGRVKAKIKSVEDLIKYVDDNTSEGRYYLFFDEIQAIENWQDACKTLRLNHSVFITGSNSKLLSKEFVKELSGRYVSFQIRPFVYKELLEYGKELKKDISVIDYLVWGGFPKRIEMQDSESQYRYLYELNETIVYNDLINRYKIRKIELFKQIVDYILQSNSRIYSANSIAKYIKQNNVSCSVNTIMNYISYLETAYVIESVDNYSTKIKRKLSYFKKIYNEDVALNSLRVIDNKFDLTHNLENIVYLELLYMGYTVTTYSNNGKEIDFLAKKGNYKYFIQVSYSLLDEKTYKREFNAFKEADPLIKKIIISNDELDYSTSMVKHLQFKQFLLLNSLEEI